MNRLCWIAVLASGAGPLIATAQVPTKMAPSSLQLNLSHVAPPPKLTRPQLLNRLRTVPAGSATTTPTSPTPPAQEPAPGVVERALLSIGQMYDGAGYLWLSRITSQQSSSDPAPRILLQDDSTWTVSFRGSTNIHAIDCAITAQNIQVAYEITQYLDNNTTRVSQGSAPLIDNHLVITVPRGGADNWVKVVFDPSIRPNISYIFHSCQILELT